MKILFILIIVMPIIIMCILFIMKILSILIMVLLILIMVFSSVLLTMMVRSGAVYNTAYDDDFDEEGEAKVGMVMVVMRMMNH